MNIFHFFTADYSVEMRFFTFCGKASMIMQWYECDMKIPEQVP